MERLKLKRSGPSSSFSPAFQGGAEHNVPVVISKIFKDQIGKEIFYLTTVIHHIDLGSVNET